MYYPDPIVHVLLLVGLVFNTKSLYKGVPTVHFALYIKIALCRLKDLGK